MKTEARIAGPDRGFAMVGVAAALLIVLIMATMASGYMQDYLKSRQWQLMAAQTSRFTQAVESYSGRYYAEVQAASTTTKPVTVTAQMLKNTGFLPAGFRDTNSNGQQLKALLIRNAQHAELLQGLVITTDGQPLPYKALRQISLDISAGLGGYIRDGRTAVGAMNSWTVPLAGFGTSGGNGHIAVLLSPETLTGAREDSDRLYRFQVNGRPELNKMHTSIDMGGNNLNSAGVVNGRYGNFDVSIVSNGPVTAGGDIRSTGGWIISRHGRGWMDETHGGGFYMTDNEWIRSLNNKNIYTGGQLKGGSVRSDGDLSAGGILKLDQVNVAGTWCPQKGAISYDSSGGILTCQYGRWQADSKFDGRYEYIGAFQYSYSAVNQSDKAIMVYASGGASVQNKKVKGGDNCLNTWALAGQVNGGFVTGAGNANSGWSKSGSISFLVPSGSTWTVISDPLPSYGCSPGSFSINVFTLN
ncbi:shufflon system plasmid conjugative transfer pilus tip adhesin PilV [Salmonella enterica]|nr:shufflon system plasmid conjugative transfer pilus tip adhesin PilV [Salmonella enterica]